MPVKTRIPGRTDQMTAPASVSMLLLRNVPLFSMLSENQLVLLTGAVSRKSFPRGTTIIAAGDVTESLYVVISGRLKVMISDDEEREVILAILGPNEFFGEMGLIAARRSWYRECAIARFRGSHPP